MIVTAIVVGLAFSVLRLVQNQMQSISKNFDTNAKLAIFEQRLLQDINDKSNVVFHKEQETLEMTSPIDTVYYKFYEGFTVRNADTIRLKLQLDKILFNGHEVFEGEVDAIKLSAEKEFPEYTIFVSKENDSALLMNNDGI
jgi:hypothetical protein